MTQSRKGSAIEASVNMVAGFIIAWLAGRVIYPMMGLDVSAGQNFVITCLFTVVSLARSYTLRRVFNRITHRNK